MNNTDIGIGDLVRVSSGQIGRVITIWNANTIDKEISYWIKTSNGECKKYKRECLTKCFLPVTIIQPKNMKIKSYKMAIVPFEYVPHNVVFRYKNDWWRRITGTDQQAEVFIDAEKIATSPKNFSFIKKDALVALNKSSLERPVSYAYIVEEFDVENN